MASSDQPTVILSLAPEAWVAVSTFFLGAVTLFLVIVGWVQIREARKQNQRWHTLEVCNQYHLDLAIGRSISRLRAGKINGSIASGQGDYKPDVSRLLNYLDGMAIGIAQGLYIERLARDHMQVIVTKHVKDYLSDEAAKRFEIDPENFRHLKALDERWRALSRPHFDEGNR